MGNSGGNGLTDTDMKAITELLDDFALCYACTTCNSICPAFQTDPEKNPRALFNDLIEQQNNPAGLIQSAWWCCACYSCEVHCPQGVPLTSLFYALKQLSFRKNLAVPPNVKHALKNQSTGYGFAFSSQVKKKRASLGLPDLIGPDPDEITGLITRVQAKDGKSNG